MVLKKEPFVRYKLDEEKKADKSTIFTVYMNNEEYEAFKRYKVILEQPKDSTALKQLAELGKILIDDKKTALILDTVFKNKRNNKRVGIDLIE